CRSSDDWRASPRSSCEARSHSPGSRRPVPRSPVPGSPFRPLQELVGSPGVDDAGGIDGATCGAVAADWQPLQLAGGVSVAINREEAAAISGGGQQTPRRVATFDAAVDLDRLPVLRAGFEDGGAVELGLGAVARTLPHSPGA